MAAAQPTKHMFVTGGVASSLGKGLTASSLGQPASRARPAGHDAEARPVPQRRPRHHEPVPARRGVRHRRRRRNRPRRRSLRALPRRRPARIGERHHRSDLLVGDRQGATRGVPRRHRPGDPAHHQRDQVAHPPDGRSDVDVVITEVGGTVGDIESLPFLEAVRQVRHEVGRDNVFFVHVSLLPYIGPSGELKTKPTQHSVAALRSIGILPDAIVLRADRPVPQANKRKISLDVRRRRGGGRGGRRRPVDLRHSQGAAQRRARRVRRPPARSAVPRRQLGRVGRAAAPRSPPRARSDCGARGQVHRSSGRLPVGHRGAACGRLRATTLG